MKTIAFIPARCGSKAIKLKNIKKFCGKPLIYWNLKELEKTEDIDKIFVATDCDEISSVVNSFNFKKVEIYHRSTDNASDSSTTESVILEFINKNNLDDRVTFILAQLTSPFTVAKDFNNALKLFNEKQYDSVLSCALTKRFFWGKDGNSLNYDYRNRPRRQDFEGQFIENGAIYINSVANIKQFNNRLSGTIGVYVMKDYTSLELDEEHDWEIGEILMKKYILLQTADIKKDIKLVLADIDGTLTDTGMYYSEKGDELKKFSAYDGKAFELIREKGILTGIITAEDRKLNKRRVKKLKLDYSFHANKNKLKTVKDLCSDLNISLENVAFIGDDINDFELLSNVGLAACPANAVSKIKKIPGIIHLKSYGGNGALREFADEYII